MGVQFFAVQITFDAIVSPGSETPISNAASVTPPAGIADPDVNNIASDGPDEHGIFRNGLE